MGLMSNKKMLPLIILFVLWEHSDAGHHLSTDELVQKVLCVYQPKDACTYDSNKRLIVSYLNDLIIFFKQMTEYGYMDEKIEIEAISGKGSKGNIREYYVKKRPLDDVEIRMLIDSILFAPGMDDDKARGLIDKVLAFTSKHFVNVHRYVRIGDVVKKTDNKEVFDTIGILDEAIESRKRADFDYRGNRCTGVSPYFLVVYGGRYYCIARCEGGSKLTHFRLDRISDCVLTDEDTYDIRLLDEVGPDGEFRLDEYLKRHPRMSLDIVVTVVLDVREDFIDTVRQEFQVDVEYPRFMNPYDNAVRRVKVTSCKGALSNWLINVPELAWVEKGDKSGVVDEMRMKARRVLEVYG